MSKQTQTWGAVAVLTVLGIVWIKRQRQKALYEPLQRSSLRELLTRVEDEESTGSGTVTKESDYPSDWWTSTELLDLERRGIFAKVRRFVHCHF